MKMNILGAMSLAAIALVGCAKKEASTADTSAVEEAEVIDEAAAAAADAAAEAADVYAEPTVFDIAAVRTRDALTAAADAAFAQVDADASGTLSQTEFYALAALMAPAAPVEEAVEDVYETAAADAPSMAADTGDAVDAALSEEPSADSTALDASFAAIAGADANLTSDDLRAAFLARFDAADVNLDGALDDDESATFAAAQLF